jgi:hypothetical protein
VTASSRTKAVGIGGGVDGRGPSFEAAQSHSAVKKAGDDHAQVGSCQTERRPRNPATAGGPDIITINGVKAAPPAVLSSQCFPEWGGLVE